MARRLFTLLSALSLALCVGSVTLWVRSGSGSDYFRYTWVSDSLGRDGAGASTLTVRQPNFYSWQGTVLFVLRWNEVQYRSDADAERAKANPDLAPGPRWRRWEGEERRVVIDGLEEEGSSVRFWDHCRVAWDTGKSERHHHRQAAALVPHWLLVSLTAVLPALGLLRARRRLAARARWRRGLCPRCGYDLRATPGRCPECGTAPAEKEA